MAKSLKNYNLLSKMQSLVHRELHFNILRMAD